MHFQAILPDPRLARLVKYYWIVIGTDCNHQKIVPDGCPEFIFHFADRYQIKSSEDKFERQSPALIAGQLNTPIILKPEGKSEILGVKFFPHAVWQLFGLNMKLLTNQALSFSEVLGARFELITDQLLNCVSQNKRIEFIESFLLKMLALCNRDASRILTLTNTILNASGEMSIRSLTKKLRISERQVERIFNDTIGMSPKRFARIIRYTNVYEAIQNPNMTTADAVYLAGFFDQPHFNKDFQEFTGDTPGKYFKSNNAFAKFFMGQ